MNRRHIKDPSTSSESNLLLSQSLLSTVVDAIRGCTTKLQFASLVLEVGRQTEPTNLQHLFPLPLPDKQNEMKYKSNIVTARSVVDLFTICIDEGSLAASASALPLLTSKGQARYYCGLLLDEAIDNFVQNTKSDYCNFDKTEEERRALGDFFRFGMKLEDAEYFEEKLDIEHQEERIYPDCNSINTMDGSYSNRSFILETPEVAQRNLFCSFNASSSSILNYIVPSSMLGESNKQRMEDAIRREASSFIKTSLDVPGLDFAMLPNWDNYFDSENSNAVEMNNVADLVGDALLGLLQMDNHWKAITALSRMILREGVEVPSSFDLFVEVANKSQPLDILSAIPESYDVNNGIERNLITYIEEEIKLCCAQITVVDADAVVDMALLLIYRIHALPLADAGDQALMETGLVLIVLVGCDRAGRSQSIQDMLNQDCMLNKCYQEVTSTANRQFLRI
eukprot:CAMPEP_0168206580 /NCGR_PEP_ID=MMETSP0140_2-20121125/1021_1 /TAXON_ID=44445 /ORGANISM="Pseudo-nitzschia australis, Strain 10249 10 AB" /LENGTH=452 /DNA_ID=CAMNT_0008132741 /DNA_START=29 /DNA_END=1387 /DNA_ORIENTATION=+